MAEYYNGQLVTKNEKHNKVLIEIGAGIMVDEGIVPLVKSLNDHKNISSIRSCQGSIGDEKSAYVAFIYVGPSEKKHTFFFKFAEAIDSYLANGECDHERFNMMWSGCFGSSPNAKLSTFPLPGNIKMLAKAVSTILKTIPSH